MGLLPSLPGPAPRQVSLLFRADAERLRRALPEGCTTPLHGPWALLELACALPPTERAGAEVALLAWRAPCIDVAGNRGTFVLERWTSARLGSGWPDRWVAQRLSSERGERHVTWDEEVGDLSVDVRAGSHRLCFGSTPVGRPTRSVFVTTRQAEAHLAEYASVLNPHPLGRILDRVGLQGGSQSLQPLSLHRLDVSSPTVTQDGGIADGWKIEFDSAFRITAVRRNLAPQTRTWRRTPARNEPSSSNALPLQ